MAKTEVDARSGAARRGARRSGNNGRRDEDLESGFVLIPADLREVPRRVDDVHAGAEALAHAEVLRAFCSCAVVYDEDAFGNKEATTPRIRRG